MGPSVAQQNLLIAMEAEPRMNSRTNNHALRKAYRPAGVYAVTGIRPASGDLVAAGGPRSPNDSLDPLPTRRVQEGTPLEDDLTGRRVGRLTVVGPSSKRPARWVVRCDCGVFSIRKARAIRNPENTSDCCGTCGYLAALRRNHCFALTGRYPGER